MAKGILTIKAKPSYKDIPGRQYHFGRDLLDRIQQTLNDSIIFYEPRRPSSDPNSRGGRLAYFAVATPVRIRPDPEMDDHFFCDLENYVDFLRPVKFKEGGHYYESALQKEDGSTNRGRFGHSVRIIPESEFETILAAGFASMLSDLSTSNPNAGDDEEVLVVDRPLVQMTTLKPFRALAFKKSVRQAYDYRCAITGLAVLGADGKAEVHAAHIRSVADKGSDSVRNGLALTRTVHWLFDEGLIAVNDDMEILVAEKFVPPRLTRLINESGRLNLPADSSKYPHPHFLAHHRNTCFVGGERASDVLARQSGG